ncbi:MAG: HipA domain-containing protein [Saprospiraceae bacterium]|nr:HipA domain-containing protein [Saprospiraceae bacterium]
MENKCLYCYQPLERDLDFHMRCSKEFFGTPLPPKLEYSFDQLHELAKSVVERSISVPGVQAKLSMSLLRGVQKSDTRLTIVGALGGQYIFKPPSDRFPEMPANQNVTMRMAEAFGIRVVPSSLIRLASGELSYITKRIDRSETGEKIHMLDMFQITEAFDKYKSSMERVGKALERYSDNPLLDKIFFFELALFSFITGNNDMHLKNFSMIQSPSGWILSPAYDLLNVSAVNPEDAEEFALTLAGKKKKLRRLHFEQLGQDLKMTERQIRGAFKRIREHRSEAIDWIDRSFLSPGLQKTYMEVLEKRYHALGISF